MNKRLNKLVLSLLLLLSQQGLGVAQQLPYKNSALPVQDRVEDLLQRMTLEEKIAQIFVLALKKVLILWLIKMQLPNLDMSI